MIFFQCIFDCLPENDCTHIFWHRSSIFSTVNFSFDKNDNLHVGSMHFFHFQAPILYAYMCIRLLNSTADWVDFEMNENDFLKNISVLIQLMQNRSFDLHLTAVQVFRNLWFTCTCILDQLNWLRADVTHPISHSTDKGKSSGLHVTLILFDFIEIWKFLFSEWTNPESKCRDFNYCYNFPCEHGRCENVIRRNREKSYRRCVCDGTGYTGANCHLNVDECSLPDRRVCPNHGKCEDKDGSYACRCVTPFFGNDCNMCNRSAVDGDLCETFVSRILGSRITLVKYLILSVSCAIKVVTLGFILSKCRAPSSRR